MDLVIGKNLLRPFQQLVEVDGKNIPKINLPPFSIHLFLFWRPPLMKVTAFYLVTQARVVQSTPSTLLSNETPIPIVSAS